MIRRAREQQIILASGSPKRAELFSKLGIQFRVVVSGCAENMEGQKNPRALARRLSQEKARCVAEQYPRAVVIAADTFGVIGSAFYGKPSTISEALGMLRALSGKMHLVVTGVTVIDGSKKKEHSFVSETKVWFRSVTEKELHQYTASKEWEGKGAGYTLLGRAAPFIERIDGEPGTVLGLPLCALAKLLKKLGVIIPH